MENAGEQPRRTSRVRKTPTKFSQDFDTLDNSPTPRAWDEHGLRAFYDAAVQYGSSNLRKVAQACGRSSTMCEDLYATHKPFLDTINSTNADAMWQYFRSGASSVLVPASSSAPAPRGGNSSGLAPTLEAGGMSPAANPTSGGRRGGSRKPGSRTPVVPAVEPPTAGKQGTKRNTPRRAANDMTGPGMGSPNQDGGPEMRAGPPTRRRRLDFSNMHESSPALAFATGDSPYSKLDMLAAAASEAAGQAQTPAVSDHSHERPAAARSARHIPPVPTVPDGPPDAADGYYTPRQTSADGGGLNKRGVEDEGDVLNSSGVRGLAGAAAQRNKRLREHEHEHDAPNGPAIDLQKLEARGNASRSAQIGATSEGRDMQHSSAPVGSDQQGTAGAGAAYSGAVSGLVSSHPGRARRPMPGGSITTPVHSKAASGAAQMTGTSVRKVSRKSPPERLPLHLMQHRAWLMPGSMQGSNSQAATEVDAAAMPAVNGGSTTASMGEPERQLRHCLGLRARRWAMFEFVTPPIDRAFYEDGSMSEYLHSLGLHQIASFSKADMSFIRRALGAPPRRFSDAFVRSERCALHAHRDRCRALYEVRNASDSSALPPGVPPQCVVGQTVVARHPMLRTLHDGDVLTVGASTYMVQFLRSELGVGKVPDTDLAPADSLCWTPLVRSNVAGGASMGGTSSAGAQDVPQDVGEQDFGLMDKVTGLLTRKAKLLDELKAINNEAQEGQHQLGDGCFDKSFQMKYANKVAEFKAVNSELAGSCTALKGRVEEVTSLQGIATRTAAAAAAAAPPTGEEGVAQVAGSIVEESMAEAATLVHNLFQIQRQKRASEVAASASLATGAAAAGGALPPEVSGSGKLPSPPAAPENGKAACDASHAARPESGSAAAPARTSTPPETQAAVPAVKQEPEVTGGSAGAAGAVVPRDSKSPPAAAENPSSLALLVDDESLMHMSIKLTAMFIAIQRCAASCHDTRTVQRALIKLVADLKPTSSRNTAQYQLITKNVGRLSCHLGAR